MGDPVADGGVIFHKLALPLAGFAGGVIFHKLALPLAGFAGGVISLSFVKELTGKQAMAAVLTGTVTAIYGTPAALHFFGLASAPYENGVAFVIGLTAMNIIPGLLKLSEVFKRDPRSFIGGGK